MSSLDDDLDSMRLESGSSFEEMSDDEMDSNSWNERKSESDAEFMEEHGIDEDVVLVVTRKIGNNNQEKRVIQQQRE